VIVVEVVGLELLGHHGASEGEQERGQTFLFDLRLEVSDAALSDQIEDAVDYREVVRCVQTVSDGHRFSLLEALAAAVAEAILERFPVEHVRVRVRKPEVKPAGLNVDWTAATAERPS
jgi:7,8-dihydroneopterin aldolase/epimerase/oxygenase